MKTLLLTLISVLALNSYAQIISYSTNDTIQIDVPNDPNMSFLLDINQDGIFDIAVYQNSSSASTCFLWGITDSSDILQQYYQYTGVSGWELRKMTDSVISDNSSWMAVQQITPTTSTGGGNVYVNHPNYISNILNQNIYFGFRFFVEGADFISRPHYGCLDATLTQNKVFILHGWSYETQPNTPITCTDSLLIDVTGIEELSSTPKQLVKITDLMGRETEFKANTPLIYYYSDGTIKRVFRLEE